MEHKHITPKFVEDLCTFDCFESGPDSNFVLENSSLREIMLSYGLDKSKIFGEIREEIVQCSACQDNYIIYLQKINTLINRNRQSVGEPPKDLDPLYLLQ